MWALKGYPLQRGSPKEHHDAPTLFLRLSASPSADFYKLEEPLDRNSITGFFLLCIASQKPPFEATSGQPINVNKFLA